MNHYQKKHSMLVSRVSTLCEDMMQFKEEIEKRGREIEIQENEKKYGFKIGSSLLWKGVKVKLVSYKMGVPNVSLWVSENRTSSVIHKVNKIEELTIL